MMTTRTYYLPKNRFALYVLNKIVDKVGCSIGDIKVMQYDAIRVPLTCNEKDIGVVEKILKTFDMLDA